MFTKILIANRGEIACRVAATAKLMGIKTVAVYSDADAHSKHVQVCDEAYRLGPAAAKESYLKGDAILEIAKATGAQAIHPGYGFLSENQEFAADCEKLGIAFIGPPASAIAAMGSKSAAKALMEKAGVPLVPGYHGDNQDPDFLHTQADKIGYPVLIKASAGGGGKGMRTVTQSGEFIAALVSCKREAINAFSDDKVLIERYVLKPRHIEIQVFADMHGNCVYLHERDCSVQRRHQKVLEEAPAPGMTPERRKAMGEAACAAAKTVGYVGAGTVEFIASPNGDFFFMEMNTRLQVEHPVTEMITGFDLVRWQLEVASGKTLPATQDQLQIKGHALEARIYAENPEKGFLPSVGTLTHLRTPSASEFTFDRAMYDTAIAAIRIDSGVRLGDTISAYYDPMIAKLIVWGKDRDAARAAMSNALAKFEAVGPATNINFLKRLMDCPSFATADLDTALIEREKALLLPGSTESRDSEICLAISALLAVEGLASAKALQPSFPSDPLGSCDGWRSAAQQPREIMIERRGEPVGKPIAVKVGYAKQSYTITIDGRITCIAGLQLANQTNKGSFSGSFVLTGLMGSQAFELPVYVDRSKAGDRLIYCFSADTHSVWRIIPIQEAYARASAGDAAAADAIASPMPGKIIALHVKVGDAVAQGQALLVLEAMKMEYSVEATKAGTVKHIAGEIGTQIAEGSILIEVS